MLKNKEDCKDKCEIEAEESNRDYLKSLDTNQIDLLTHNEESRKRFDKALKQYGLQLICYLKVIAEDK